LAEFAYDLEKTHAWVHEHWRHCIVLARAGAGGGAIAMMEGFDAQIDDLAGRMPPEDGALFRAAVKAENDRLNTLQAQDSAALYETLGVTDAMLGDIDRQRRARRGLEGQSGGCAVLIGFVLTGAGLLVAAGAFL
jgi:hypothetical protein